jgi:hypothetical protein
MGRPVEPPPNVRNALHALFGARVDSVRVVEHSLFARLHGRAIATTRRRAIYLRGSAADFFGNADLVLHEYCHVLHQWEPGHLTSLAYVAEWMRRGYWLNRFEVEARAFASRHLHRFHALLRDGADLDQPSSASRR